jgi:hypothetical protein
MGPPMIYRRLPLCGLLCACATAAAAQEPNGRIDLDREIGSAPLAMPGFAVARISFIENDTQCPEDRGTLRISDGVMTQLHTGPLATARGRAGDTAWQLPYAPKCFNDRDGKL